MVNETRSESRHAKQQLECDIVMAGGVTSGIIYPGAVAMIARKFRFRSIGGTSVGAIAAAVTAAAEYGRRTGKNLNAFEIVGSLPKTLGEAAADGHTRLFHLFTPEPATRPLLALVTPLFAQSGRAKQFLRILSITCSSWQVALPLGVSLLVGLAVVLSVLITSGLLLSAMAFAMTIASTFVVWCASTLAMLGRQWLPAWRRNRYGICTGLSSPDPAAIARHNFESLTQWMQRALVMLGREWLRAWRRKRISTGLSSPDPTTSVRHDFEGLTRWMHRAVQEAAGRSIDDEPLTFGQLWSLGDGLSQESSPHSPREIELAMIASDISRNRTVQLPFLETPSPLYIEADILKDYFPPSVVNWMKKCHGEYDKRVEQRCDVIRLPRPQDLPVVLGARLSLSFPVLLSALPLMTPDFAKGKGALGYIPLRRVWFSDGGLTSNFPIHFFDSPIPSRPTFCLNLVDFDAEAPNIVSTDGIDEEDASSSTAGEASTKPIAQPRSASRTAENRPDIREASDPAPNDDVWGFVSIAKGNQFVPAPFTAFDTEPGTGVLSFAATLVNTARYWSDNQMLLAPGIRDRVVNIALRDDEGGLNLDMSANVIADLDWRGRAAGMLIAARFDPTQDIDPESGGSNEHMFANHRWVRFRGFMASFEDMSRRFARSRRASDTAAYQRGESLLDDMIGGMAKEKLGYTAPSGAKVYYKAATDKFEQLSLWMAGTTSRDAAATFDRPREYKGDQVRKPAGGAPRPTMRGRLRPLVDNDPRSESAELPDPRD
jgi:predicted acylesterase/phospholipase RssA